MKRLVLLFFFGGLAVMLAACGGGGGGSGSGGSNGHSNVATSAWNVISVPNGNFSGVVYGAGKFIAFGATNATSTDAQTWTLLPAQVSPLITQTSDIAFGNGVFVAVGGVNTSGGSSSQYRGVVLSSSDGNQWTDVTPAPSPGSMAPAWGPGPLGLSRVIYANGMFVAIGQMGTVLASNDGINWHDKTAPVTDPSQLYPTRNDGGTGFGNFLPFDLAFANGTFFSTGYAFCPFDCHGIGTHEQGASLFSSVGSVNWLSANNQTNSAYLTGAIASNGSLIVAAADSTDGNTLLFSNDGNVWQVPGNLSAGAKKSLAFSNNLSGTVSKIIYGNGTYVAAGLNGLLLSSTDGMSWTSVNDGSAGQLTSTNLTGGVYGNGKFVIVGGGAIVVSQ